MAATTKSVTILGTAAVVAAADDCADAAVTTVVKVSGALVWIAFVVNAADVAEPVVSGVAGTAIARLVFTAVLFATRNWLVGLELSAFGGEAATAAACTGRTWVPDDLPF